jgi:hypothetical protein
VRSQRSPDPKQKSFEFSPLSPSADPPSPTPAPAPTPTQPADDALDAALGGPNDAVRVQFALDPDTLDSNL